MQSQMSYNISVMIVATNYRIIITAYHRSVS